MRLRRSISTCLVMEVKRYVRYFYVNDFASRVKTVCLGLLVRDIKGAWVLDTGRDGGDMECDIGLGVADFHLRWRGGLMNDCDGHG